MREPWQDNVFIVLVLIVVAFVLWKWGAPFPASPVVPVDTLP